QAQQQVTVQQATEPLVASEQRRDKVGGGGAPPGNPPSPPVAQAKRPVTRQALAMVTPAAPAFTWSIENGVLRVTPARDGALRIEALLQAAAKVDGAARAPLVVATAKRGVVAEFAIPAEAAAVRVSFSASSVSPDALTSQD